MPRAELKEILFSFLLFFVREKEVLLGYQSAEFFSQRSATGVNNKLVFGCYGLVYDYNSRHTNHDLHEVVVDMKCIGSWEQMLACC